MEIIGLVATIQTHGASLFMYYTEDSNIFALIACSLYAISVLRCLVKKEPHPPIRMKLLKYTATCCLAVTFTVVICVLAPPMGAEGFKMMLFGGSMLYHHFLCPVLALISFIFFETEPSLEKRYTLYALIPTITYALVSVVLNIAHVMVGPYPFLLVYRQPVYMSCVWFVIIIGGAYLMACLIRKLNNRSIERKS